jgi:antitoxin HicB
MLAYPAKLQKDGKYLMVTFPDIPEAHSMGDSVEDALAMGAEALELALDFYFETHRTVPAPSKVKRGQYVVELPLSVSAKVMLWNEMLRKNVKPAELARRLHTTPQEVNRMTDVRHSTKIDTLAKAIAAVGGKKLIVKTVAA